MAIYAVGDIHGCYDELRQLLDKLHFNPEKDQLWSVGDMVNRGPQSLKVLQYMHALGESAQAVLGNHELSLLFRSGEKKHRLHPFFSTLLQAKDVEDLLFWLRHRPLFHQNPALGWCMVHASVHPAWSLAQALTYSKALEAILQGEDWWSFLALVFAMDIPAQEPEDKGSDAHLAFCLDVFTRARFCSSQHAFYWKHGLTFSDKKPWFSLRKREEMRIAYGHWSEMGLVADQQHVLGLDSGCVWGKQLTVARLDVSPVQFVQVQSLQV